MQMFSEKKIAFIHLLQEIVLFITYFESFLDNLDIKHEGVRFWRTPLMKLSLMREKSMDTRACGWLWNLGDNYFLAIDCIR